MVQKLLDALRLKVCSHQFSWPRRTADGKYYQVCLLCAAKYEYDWGRMRRTRRVAAIPAESWVAALPSRDHVRAAPPAARTPRAELHAGARYRIKGALQWHEGTVENLSQSGLCLATRWELPKTTLLELVFEMPEQVSGEKPCNVLCQARVARTEPSASGAWLALSILDYKFLPRAEGL